MKSLRTTTMVSVLLLVIAACADATAPTTTSGPSGTTSPPTTSPPTTVAPTTTTVAPTTTEPVATQTVEVFFSHGDGADCSEVKGYPREFPADLDRLVVAFDALVGGPTDPEAADGASSFFSADTSEVIRSVTLGNDGILSVDFEDVRAQLNNASTSCGSEALLAQLTSTAFQFEDVERVRFAINGSCSLFFNWLQRECVEYTREGTTSPFRTEDLADGSGCTPGTDELPDGEWFGYLDEVAATELTFDLACWFSLPASAQAAAEDGEESPPPNDYYVRNNNPMLRTVPVADEVQVSWLPSMGGPDLATIDYAAWITARAERGNLGQPGVWLVVTDGEVTSITEQYVP